MPAAARRVFRLSLTMSLSLALAYGLGFDLPFLAPIFALLLTSPPSPPMGIKQLFGLSLLLVLALGTGILLTPVLVQYPAVGITLVAIGVFFSSYITVILGKGLPGALLTVGITLITATGTLSHDLAMMVIEALVAGVVLAVICHWCVYPLFPEDAVAGPGGAAAVVDAADPWIATRTVLVVLPAYLLTLTNPGAYLAIIMKAVSLSQQVSVMHARDAARELLGSTFLGGCLAMVFWAALSISVNLPMFFLWMLLFSVMLTARFYQVLPTRYPPSFWQNALVTMLILLGSAVQDSANGADVYQAFATRMGLFIGVTTYAMFAVMVLERLRERSARKRRAAPV